MAFTQEDLETLKQAYLKGAAVAEVTHNGKKVVYRGAAEIKKAIDEIELELGVREKTVRFAGRTSKGLR